MDLVFDIKPKTIKTEGGEEETIIPDVIMVDNMSFPLYKFKFNKTKKGGRKPHLKVSLHPKRTKATKEGTYNITDGNGSLQLIDDLFAVKGDPKGQMEAYIGWLRKQKVNGGSGFKTMGDLLDANEGVEQQLMKYMVDDIAETNAPLRIGLDAMDEDTQKTYAGLSYSRFIFNDRRFMGGITGKFMSESLDATELEMERVAQEAERKGALRGARAVGQAVGSQTLTNEELQETQKQLDDIKDALGTGAYKQLSNRLRGKYLDNQGRVRPDLSRQDSNNLKQLITAENEKMNRPPQTMTDAEMKQYEDQRYYTTKRPDQSNPRFQISQDRIDKFADLEGADFSYENLIRDGEGVVIGYDKSYGTPITPHTDPEILGVLNPTPSETDALTQFEREIQEAHRVRDTLPTGYLIHKHKDEGAMEAKAPVKAPSLPPPPPTLAQQLSSNPFSLDGDQVAPDGAEAKNAIVGVQPHQNLGAGAGAVVQPNQAVGLGQGYAGGVIGSAMGQAFRRRQRNNAQQFQQRSAQMDAEANRIAELGIGATRTDERGLPPADPAIMPTTRTGETPETRIQQGVAEAYEKESKDEGAIQDKYADVSLYGYDKQVSMFAKKQGRDFTYTKEMIRKSKDAPSKDPKIKKQQTKAILAEWGYTIGIKKLKTKDYEECLEVYTFVHLARDMYRLERKWKRALSRMNTQASAQSANDLNQLVDEARGGGAGNVGLVIQTPNAIPLGSVAGILSGASSSAGGFSMLGSDVASSLGGSMRSNPRGSEDDAGLSDRTATASTASSSSGSDSGVSDLRRAFAEANASSGGSDGNPRGFDEDSGYRRRLAGFNTDVNYSNTHQNRDVRYSNVVATNAQGIISNNRIPNAPQGVQSIRKPRALGTTYSHRPSQARGGYKAKRIKQHRPRLNVKEVEFKMKRHRINSNLGFVNLLKQNPTQEGVMPPFRLRSGEVKLNRIKF